MTSTTESRSPVLTGGRPLRTVPENATAGEVTAIRAETQLSALGVTEWPQYGTPGWLRLDPKDPRCYVATLEAAELWRRERAEYARLDCLMQADPELWYAETFSDARKTAARLVPAIAAMRTAKDVKDARSRPYVVHQLKATAAWPPVAIPGQSGRYLTPGTEISE